MYNILQGSQDHIIAIRIEDYVEAQDCNTLLPHLRNRIHEHGRIRLLIELKDFHGIEILSALKALPYVIRYGKHVEKKAIITDEEWICRWAKLLTSFSKTRVHCFPSTKLEQAWEWIRQ